MKAKTLLNSIAMLFIFIHSLSAFSKTEAIRLNQVGFYPKGPKMAIVVDDNSETFFITTPDLNDTVFSGNLSLAKYWEYSDEIVKHADFSELDTKGTFVVVVPGLGYSSAFDITPRVHQEIARKTTKAFYFQRMSIDLTEQYAGKWFRPMGHPDNHVLIHSSAASPERPEGAVISCPRGWYDAGDFNKYIVNSGISVYTLLAIYEQFPEYSRYLELNIPESGDTIPDLLDETLWNIRWMLAMQDPNDGGVYHKCTHANFSGVVMPHEATAPRYVVQKSSTATLDFAAVMAQSSRIFREFEVQLPGLADSCLSAALAAWNWARSHPDTYYRQNDNNEVYLPEITTGEYGDRNDDDEFCWAASELYITTKQDSFISLVNPMTQNNISLPGWNSVRTLGWYSLANYRKELTAAVDTTALKNRLIAYANEIKKELNNSAYRVLITTFPWGSNGVVANQAIAMIQAFELTADSSYLDAAIANLDYLLGRNATTYCFVSDAGDKPPLHFHHRQSEADDVKEPIPGFLAGGPNPSQQDNCPGYPSDLPARSYLDDFCSYASNEICINWNAPIAYLTTALEAIYSETGKPVTITAHILSPQNSSRFFDDERINISADISISHGTIHKVEFFANEIKIGEDDFAPYEMIWDNLHAGVYELRAKAEDELGGFLYSDPVNIFIMSSERAGKILFVVGSTDLNDGDKAVRDYLIRADYTLDIQDDNDSNVFQLEGTDAILVSSTAGATSKIRTELVNCGVPLLSWEATLFDDFGWTGKRRNTDYGYIDGSMIDIISEDHEIAAGLTGNIDLTSTLQEITWAIPKNIASIIATIEGDLNKPVIFSYETGSWLLTERTAKARQVGLCFSDNSPAELTDNGWKIFLAAIRWAQNGQRVFVNDKDVPMPQSRQLFPNYPNPFNPGTQIKYFLGKNTNVSIVVFNTKGQFIKRLVDEFQNRGEHAVLWDGRNEQGVSVSSGIYFSKIKIENFEKTSKMMLIK